MSGAESSQGPGWWQASDGKWYPPSSPPTPQPPALPPVGPLPAGAPLLQGDDDGSTDGSFFSRLFDMSFTRFVTPSLIKVLFILAVVVVSLMSVFLLIGGLATIGDGGIFLVILAPLYWFLGIIYSRVLLELAVVFFRIERNTRPKT